MKDDEAIDSAYELASSLEAWDLLRVAARDEKLTAYARCSAVDVFFGDEETVPEAVTIADELLSASGADVSLRRHLVSSLRGYADEEHPRILRILRRVAAADTND